MEGRKENELKKEKKIREKLESAPRYMKAYYDTIYTKSYTTQNVYIRYVLDFIKYLENEYGYDINDVNCFKEVKASTINSYMKSLNAGNSIKASRLFGIKSFFKYLIGDEIISNDPCNRVEVPKDNEEHKITSLTKREIKIIKQNIMNGCGSERARARQARWRSRDYAIIMMGLSLGLRVTSLSEININDINFDTMELKIVEKGNKERTLMFSENLKEIILEWIEDRNVMLSNKGVDTDALFISGLMKRITSDAIADIVKKYTYNIDKHITPHKLRSTCATNVYNNTGDIYLTADVLGHRNIANTKRYASISKERKEKAAHAMDSILF